MYYTGLLINIVNQLPVCYIIIYMQPDNWNIVVAGEWNRAIITPAWTAKTVFGLESGSTIEALVPLDGFAPYQLRHNGITLIPARGQLLFQLDKPELDFLKRGLDAARNAINDLPRTPLAACGINLRYSSSEPSSQLLDAMKCKTEKLFSDAGYKVFTRRRSDTLVFEKGCINVIADIPTDGPVGLTLNFERKTTVTQEIVEWLNQSPDAVIQKADDLVQLLIKE